MDLNQLKYKKLYSYDDDEVKYKDFIVVINYGTYCKRLIVRACCKQEIMDTTKHKIVSAKPIIERLRSSKTVPII